MRSEPDAHTYADDHTYGDSDANIDAFTQRNTNCYSNSNSDVYTYDYTYIDSNPNANGHSYTYSDSDPYTYTELYSQTYPFTKIQSVAKGSSHPRATAVNLLGRGFILFRASDAQQEV